jgi:hypothetical protein
VLPYTEAIILLSNDSLNKGSTLYFGVPSAVNTEPILLGLCFVAEGLQGRSGFIMCEQVSSDLYQKGRSSKDTKVDTAPKL